MMSSVQVWHNRMNRQFTHKCVGTISWVASWCYGEDPYLRTMTLPPYFRC